MDPLTIMALGSTALTAISSLGKGYAGSEIDNLQKSIADQNTALLVRKAGIEAKGADLAYAGGALETSRTVSQLHRVLGAETGHFASSNLDPTYGSPLLLEGYSAGQGATDLALIAARAQGSAAGALSTSAGTMAQAAGSAGQSAAFGMKSSQDIMAGILGAGTALLQGGTKMWGGLNTSTASFASGGFGAGKGLI